jgi:hypothetical protein
MRTVFQEDVALVLLELAERNQNDVSLVDPDLLAELSTNVGQTLGAVKALSLETTVSEHFDDLRILCERQFTAKRKPPRNVSHQRGALRSNLNSSRPFVSAYPPTKSHRIG